MNSDLRGCRTDENMNPQSISCHVNTAANRYNVSARVPELGEGTFSNLRLLFQHSKSEKKKKKKNNNYFLRRSSHVSDLPVGACLTVVRRTCLLHTQWWFHTVGGKAAVKTLMYFIKMTSLILSLQVALQEARKLFWMPGANNKINIYIYKYKTKVVTIVNIKHCCFVSFITLVKLFCPREHKNAHGPS